jgi:hypothetical protein
MNAAFSKGVATPSLTPLQEIAKDVIDFDGRALAQIAVHRRRQRRCRRRHGGSLS